MRRLLDQDDVIEAIYKAFCYAYCDNCEKELDEDLCGDCHRKYQNWSASRKTIEKTLNGLPSARPEQPIRCGDCKHWSEDGMCRILKEYIFNDDYFCKYAERKEG